MASLNTLWYSTAALHRRFDNYPPDSNAQMAYADSELTELQHELTLGNPPDDIADELVDVIVCLMGASMAKGVTYDHIHNALQRVIDKNNRKTDETHVLIEGKIQRRDRVGKL